MKIEDNANRVNKFEYYKSLETSSSFGNENRCSVKKLLEAREKEDYDTEHVINGRVMNIRKLKSESYIFLRDFDSDLQVHIPEIINKDFLSVIDTGDFIELKGKTICKSESDELIFEARDYLLAAKCRFIFPKQLTDKRKRYENRFLDLTINKKSISTVKSGALINRVIRKTLWENGYEEYSTPALFTSYNGGVSTPFETHFDALKKTAYLKATSEIYLKQLITAGFDSVFEIAGSFRNEGMDRFHIPGFPLLEVYKAFANADDMLDLNLQMIENILKEYNGEAKLLARDGSILDVKKEDWIRIDAYSYLKEEKGIDILADIQTLREEANKLGVHCSENSGPATVIGDLIDRFIREGSVEPIIVTHLPSSMTPLMKKNAEDERFSERYWLYVNGIDISDIGSEQDDCKEQCLELQKQFDLMHEAYPHIKVNEDIIKVASYGLPRTGGIGFSLSRMLMALENLDDVRETPVFPYI